MTLHPSSRYGLEIVSEIIWHFPTHIFSAVYAEFVITSQILNVNYRTLAM